MTRRVEEVCKAAAVASTVLRVLATVLPSAGNAQEDDRPKAPVDTAITTSEDGGGDPTWAPAWNLPSAVSTATITLSELGVVPPYVVISAGDLLTWVNPTAAPLAIQTTDDQFATEDVSATFRSLEVPASGQVT